MKDYIIKKNYEISDLIGKRNSTANKYFIIYKTQNNKEHYRYAISVGKKYGNAVFRNKIKRQIRNIIYNLDKNFKGKYDILIIVRPLAKDLNFQQIEKNLIHALTRANIIKREDK